MATEELSPSLEALWSVVRSIPLGRCASYGDVGRALPNPASGFQVGRWMARCPDGVPWWRVVTKSGGLAVHKLDPRLASEQRTRLAAEGVPFEGDQVDMAAVGWEP